MSNDTDVFGYEILGYDIKDKNKVDELKKLKKKLRHVKQD